MAKKKSSSKSNETPPDFEFSLGALESIVSELESGSLPLAEAIARYEHGVKLLKDCHGALNAVQQKIELLTNVNEEGEEQTVPFNTGSGSDAGLKSDTDDSDGGRLF